MSGSKGLGLRSIIALTRLISFINLSVYLFIHSLVLNWFATHGVLRCLLDIPSQVSRVCARRRMDAFVFPLLASLMWDSLPLKRALEVSLPHTRRITRSVFPTRSSYEQANSILPSIDFYQSIKSARPGPMLLPDIDLGATLALAWFHTLHPVRRHSREY